MKEVLILDEERQRVINHVIERLPSDYPASSNPSLGVEIHFLWKVKTGSSCGRACGGSAKFWTDNPEKVTCLICKKSPRTEEGTDYGGRIVSSEELPRVEDELRERRLRQPEDRAEGF